MKKTLRSLAVWSLSVGLLQAQDPQFSQFYSTSPYQNPAFAGQMGATRGFLISRLQWPELGSFKSVVAGVDGLASYTTHNQRELPDVGLGLVAMYSQQGSWLKTTSFAAQYSKSLYNGDFAFRFGFQVGAIGTQWGDLSRYRFVDQFVTTGNGIASPTSNDPVAGVSFSKISFDAATGALVDWDRNEGNTRDFTRWWLGVSLRHLGWAYRKKDPASNQFQSLHVSLQMGTKIPVEWIPLSNTYDRFNREEHVSLMANVRSQWGSTQLDVLGNFVYSPILLGMGYRGILLKSPKEYRFQDALISAIGYRAGNLMIQYSYDFTISSLRGYTGGSHELSLWVGFDADLFKFNVAKRRGKRATDCSTFD